jgi:hypothetical protein
VCIHIYVYVYININIHTHTYTHTYTRTHMDTHTHVTARRDLKRCTCGDSSTHSEKPVPYHIYYTQQLYRALLRICAHTPQSVAHILKSRCPSTCTIQRHYTENFWESVPARLLITTTTLYYTLYYTPARLLMRPTWTCAAVLPENTFYSK